MRHRGCHFANHHTERVNPLWGERDLRLGWVVWSCSNGCMLVGTRSTITSAIVRVCLPIPCSAIEGSTLGHIKTVPKLAAVWLKSAVSLPFGEGLACHWE